MNYRAYIIILSIISFIKSEVTFTISAREDMQTMCDRQKGHFQFVLKGQASGISGQIKITFPLKYPETCKEAECTVDSTKMFCIMDAYKHDLSGAKKVEVYEDEPKIDNFKFTNYAEYFNVDRRIINHATNCVPDGKPGPGPDDDKDKDKDKDKEKEQIFAMFNIINIQILGCFRNKNNFHFQLNTIKDDKSILKDTLKQDIYFKLPFKKPQNENAFCVIPQENISIARCSIGYSGEIEVGEEVNSTVNIDGKEYKIIFKSSSIKPITINECIEKPLFASFEVKNIEILGCFRNKNNFSFKLAKIDDQNSIMTNTLDQDIYFRMTFKKPKNEKAFCVILENNKSDEYTARCAIKYGGNIEVGVVANGTVKLKGKEYNIIFKGLSIPSTIVNECN